MKALEKDRRRRYETANGLALDVQRHLANEPISARPPSKLYKLQKAVLRNKLLFIGIGVIALLLVVSLIVVSALLARERRSRREVEAAKAKTEAESLRSQQVTKFLEDMLNGVGPSVALGQDTTILRTVLDQTAERVGKEMTNQPAVEAELRVLIGRLYRQIGNFDRAEEMDRAALAVNRKLFGSESPEAAASLNELGLALIAKNKMSEAEGVDSEALAIRRRFFGNQNTDTATSLNDLSSVYRQQGRLTEAEPMAREALGIREKLFGHERLEVADSLRNLSIILGAKGQWAESEEMAREVLAIRRKLLGLEHAWVAYSLDDVAWAARAEGKVDEAEALERESLAMRVRLLGSEHPDVAKSLYLVGDRLRQRGNLNEAYSSLCTALSIQRKGLNKDNPDLFETMRSLGLTLEAEGKMAEAEQMHREALAGWRKRGESETPQALGELENLVHVLAAQKKFGEAEQLLGEALTPGFIKRPSSADLLALRAEVMTRQGRWQEAATDAALALEHQPSNPDRFHTLAPLLAITHNRPAYEQLCRRILATFADTTNAVTADRMAKDCLLLPSLGIDLQLIGRLADTAVTAGKDDWLMPYFEVSKALSEYRQGHFADAVVWAQKAIKRSDVLYLRAHAYAVLAMAHWRLGEKVTGQEMLAKGNALAPIIYPVHEAENKADAWSGWIFARISLDEATALIESPAAAQGR